MVARKGDVNFDLLKALITEAGLSMADVLGRLTGGGLASDCTACEFRCTSCMNGCNAGPTASNMDIYSYPPYVQQLKREILAELRK